MTFQQLPADEQSGVSVEQAVVANERPKTSKRARGGQAVARGLGDASATVSNAIARGIADWNERQDRSARKRKDGALEDALENWVRAASKTLRKAAGAPEDFYDGVDKVWKGSYRKLFRLK